MKQTTRIIAFFVWFFNVFVGKMGSQGTILIGNLILYNFPIDVYIYMEKLRSFTYFGVN